MTHRIRDGGSGEVPLTFLYSLGSSLLNNVLSNRQTGRCRCLPVRGHDLEHLRPFREQTQKIGPGCAWRAVSEGVSGTLRPAACGQAACGGLGRSPTHTRVRAPGRAWRSWPPWRRAWEGPARCRRTCSPSACTYSPSAGTCSPSAQAPALPALAPAPPARGHLLPQHGHLLSQRTGTTCSPSAQPR